MFHEKGLRFHVSDHTAAGGHCASQRRWDAAVTRAQLAVILNGLLGRTLSSLDDLQRGRPIFDDNRDAQAWYFLPIQEAAAAHTAAETGEHECWPGLDSRVRRAPIAQRRGAERARGFVKMSNLGLCA